MPSIRVIAGAVIGSLFVCGLFSGQGVAQTAMESVDKLMQLLQPMNPDKSETKPSDSSPAKHSSRKAPPAAKKRASTKPAAKESTLNGASQVTVPPSEHVIDGEAVPWISLDAGHSAKVATGVDPFVEAFQAGMVSPEAANDIDLAADAQSTLASDASPAAVTVVTATGTETIAPADNSNSGAAAVSQIPGSGIGTMSWLLRVIAALSGAVATGSVAWFLIRPSASTDVWVSLNE
jgi:hypothetical protein